MIAVGERVLDSRLMIFGSFGLPGSSLGVDEAIAPDARAAPGCLAEDCVGAYLFLSSDLLSGYITGQIIEVNGGQLMP